LNLVKKLRSTILFGFFAYVVHSFSNRIGKKLFDEQVKLFFSLFWDFGLCAKFFYFQIE